MITERSASATLARAPWGSRKRWMSASDWNATTRTSPSRSSTGITVEATIHAERLRSASSCSTSSHESRSCWNVIGSAGATAGSATTASSPAAGTAAGAGGDPFRPTGPGAPGPGRWIGSPSAGPAGAAAAAVTAGGAADAGAAPASRCSRRSTRAIVPTSGSPDSGTSSRAAISSRWRRGLVAPAMSVRDFATMSAARESSALPKPRACSTSVASSSAGTPWRIAAGSLAARATMRSRSRSRRSSTKRRGSWPDCTTRSIDANSPAASAAVSAETISSSSPPCVKPSSATACS